jgi:hypothetical protein
MSLYYVEVKDEACYPCITAETEEQAKQIAWEWFIEREPFFTVRKMTCDMCYNVDQDTPDKVSACACCEDYNFFEERD